MPDDIEPLFYEVSKKKVLFARIFTAITAIIVILAIVFCLVKGSKKHTLYLCMINILLSSIIAGFLAWWYHNGVLQASAYYFMIFVGVCVIFQAIAIDIFVWNWQPFSSETSSYVNPHTMAPANHTTTRRPITH
ncbi:uncharacterized protein LOC135689543 [Rhopilema esculentum]|uniref:uncharacterized protein LOC135689543 n=1 Tax=Rhopilema esculentum TaxID=499914 RepID=UPI0031CEFEE4